MIQGLLSAEWVSYLASFPQLIVGYSGGVDSTVLLHVLASDVVLKQRLKAVHVHHGLSPSADEWVLHCERFCSQWSIPLEVHYITLSSLVNIEEQAREKRYACLLQAHACLLLAHHQEDQCETVLLQLCRGSGVKGLSGMKSHTQRAGCEIVRPFLQYSKQSLQDYAAAYDLAYIQDESNEETRFSRNFLRQEVLPLLKTKWPAVVLKVAQCAQHFQSIDDDLKALVQYDYPNLDQGPLQISKILRLPESRQMHVLRAWLALWGIKMPSVVVMNQLKKMFLESGPEASPLMLFEGYELRKYRQFLWVEAHQQWVKEEGAWTGFPHALTLGSYHYTAKLSDQEKPGIPIPVGAQIDIRFRNRGLKKWFQSLGIPSCWRDRLPFLFINGQLCALLLPQTFPLKQSLDFYVVDGYDIGQGSLRYCIYVNSL